MHSAVNKMISKNLFLTSSSIVQDVQPVAVCIEWSEFIDSLQPWRFSLDITNVMLHLKICFSNSRLVKAGNARWRGLLGAAGPHEQSVTKSYKSCVHSAAFNSSLMHLVNAASISSLTLQFSCSLNFDVAEESFVCTNRRLKKKPVINVCTGDFIECPLCHFILITGGR